MSSTLSSSPNRFVLLVLQRPGAKSRTTFPDRETVLSVKMTESGSKLGTGLKPALELPWSKKGASVGGFK